ncbi:hypothetical protein E2C01_088460 [Portunus trituberculatus]|uniref:Uncharacterized protein n=1 Tax=Portunus trituberculatus TaxID=210409 RepID=A0A5B7JGN5_PORTR|nr:hypothetical protein [Portunus trituberculatus]
MSLLRILRVGHHSPQLVVLQNARTYCRIMILQSVSVTQPASREQLPLSAILRVLHPTDWSSPLPLPLPHSAPPLPHGVSEREWWWVVVVVVMVVRH